MADEFSDASGDDADLGFPHVPLAGAKRGARGAPTADPLSELTFSPRCLFLGKRHFDLVRAHLDMKQVAAAKVAAFKAVFFDHAEVIEHFAKVVESLARPLRERPTRRAAQAVRALMCLRCCLCPPSQLRVPEEELCRPVRLARAPPSPHAAHRRPGGWACPAAQTRRTSAWLTVSTPRSFFRSLARWPLGALRRLPSGS